MDTSNEQLTMDTLNAYLSMIANAVKWAVRAEVAFTNGEFRKFNRFTDLAQVQLRDIPTYLLPIYDVKLDRAFGIR